MVYQFANNDGMLRKISKISLRVSLLQPILSTRISGYKRESICKASRATGLASINLFKTSDQAGGVRKLPRKISSANLPLPSGIFAASGWAVSTSNTSHWFSVLSLAFAHT
mmetsp:Transcript_20357/g.32771  ORF Transcript_20357/g.32771 Transcript_20357/m.32771 type:complete len:111 (+) Transcript_20357:456-788(+)